MKTIFRKSQKLLLIKHTRHACSSTSDSTYLGETLGSDRVEEVVFFFTLGSHRGSFAAGPAES